MSESSFCRVLFKESSCSVRYIIDLKERGYLESPLAYPLPVPIHHFLITVFYLWKSPLEPEEPVEANHSIPRKDYVCTRACVHTYTCVCMQVEARGLCRMSTALHLCVLHGVSH